MYEFTPAPGIKITKIVSLADDLAMALKAAPVRVVAPIPGKNAVGIEIPNRSRELVSLRRILASKEFTKSSPRLTLPGHRHRGSPMVTNLAKMPHSSARGHARARAWAQHHDLFSCTRTTLGVKFIMIDPCASSSPLRGIPHLSIRGHRPQGALPCEWACRDGAGYACLRTRSRAWTPTINR
jgi:S-DNA-T family DNA segregation ATPase FtsK/SpoIIIE